MYFLLLFDNDVTPPEIMHRNSYNLFFSFNFSKVDSMHNNTSEIKQCSHVTEVQKGCYQHEQPA